MVKKWLEDFLYPFNSINAFIVIIEADLKEQVEGSLNMSATYETVVTRAQLALVSCCTF